MNLVLVEPDELAGDVVVLTDRRATHLRAVLGAVPGTKLRAGVVGGQLGTGEILADDGTAITVRIELTGPAPAPLPIELVLAIPRPKVVTRTIEAVASFGVARVALTNAWRVDKSYLTSPRLYPAALALAARAGAEQGATTHVPPITVHPRLMELLDAEFPEQGSDGRCRLIAHPGGSPLETAFRPGPITLAVGPEGGWIDRELATFTARGFRVISLGDAILRVDTAVAAALGQLALLRRLAAR